MKYVRAFLVVYVISFALYVYLDFKKEPPQGGIRGGSVKGQLQCPHGGETADVIMESDCPWGLHS